MNASEFFKVLDIVLSRLRFTVISAKKIFTIMKEITVLQFNFNQEPNRNKNGTSSFLIEHDFAMLFIKKQFA